MNWVPQSTDMNTIENACSVLETRLREHPRHPSTLYELFFALSEEWGRLPDLFMDILWRSMPSWVVAVVKTRRHTNKY